MAEVNGWVQTTDYKGWIKVMNLLLEREGIDLRFSIAEVDEDEELLKLKLNRAK